MTKQNQANLLLLVVRVVGVVVRHLGVHEDLRQQSVGRENVRPPFSYSPVRCRNRKKANQTQNMGAKGKSAVSKRGRQRIREGN